VSNAIEVIVIEILRPVGVAACHTGVGCLAAHFSKSVRSEAPPFVMGRGSEKWATRHSAS
jgi:hypothetical protein